MLMKTILTLLGAVRPYYGWMLLGILASFVTTGSSIGLLVSAAWLIAKASLQPQFHELQLGIVAVRFFGISRGVLRYAERLLSHGTTFRIIAGIRSWFFSALDPLAPARLSRFRSADLLQRISADIDSLESLYARILSPPLNALLISLFSWLILGRIAWELALTLLLFQLLAGVVLPAASILYLKGTARRLAEVRTDKEAALLDMLQGMAELTLLGRIEEQKAAITRLKDEELALQERQARIERIQEPLTGLCMNGAVLVIAALLAPLIASGALEGIWAGVILIGVMASFEAFIPVPASALHLEKNLEAGTRILEIIEAEPEVRQTTKPDPLPATHDIAFRNVSFSYPGSSVPVLDDISFRVKEGERIAIVGPSGAGKSTIASLLLGFYPPSSGTITSGGKAIERLDADLLRRSIATVSQETYLFADTIRQNLLLANPEATDDMLKAALSRAGLPHFRERLDTWAGQHGMQLSGGERQRLAITRAILQDAPVMLLDEATANLDRITEREVMEKLFRISGMKTLLSITHRLQDMDAFDRILVLEGGNIAESGSHEELMAAKGTYSAMWELQNRSRPALLE